MATRKPTYTSEAALAAYKTRVFRDHQKEVIAAKSAAYDEGLQAGIRVARNEMRHALGLPELEPES